jgi:outer membrane protein insertion porin family
MSLNKLNSLLLSLFLLVPCALRADSDFDGKLIHSVTSTDMETEELTTLSEALGVKAGKAFDLARTDAVLKELGSSGKWMRVFIDGELEEGKLKLSLRGTRVRKLRKLEFTEVAEDVLDEVRRKVRQDQDQNADLESFSALRQALKEAYQDRGYYFAEVQFFTRNQGQDEADVEVRVVPNAPTRVAKIQVKGGPDIENAAMVDLVPLARGDVLSRIKLAAGVERINTYLRANQYPTSRVADSTFQFSPNSMEVDITVLVKMGERFQIRFVGNSVFADVQLRALLTEEVLAQTDPAVKIAQLVEAKYHSVGYPDATVSVKKTLIDNGKLNLMELIVAEGQRTIIEDLRFSTGDRLSGVDLEALFYEVSNGVLTRQLYWADGIAETLVAMQNRLLSMGYLNARISDPKVTFSEDRRSVILFFDADVGVQTLLTKVDFVGVHSFPISELEKQFTFTVGDPLNRTLVPESGNKILAFYADNGFPEAKLLKVGEAAIEISRDQQSATVKYEIEEGRSFKIGSVAIEGLRKTKSQVVLREMELEGGSIYSAHKIRSSEEKIGLIGVFSRVEVLESKSTAEPGVIDLRVVVIETRPGVGEMGIGTLYEEPRLRIRPFLGVSYRNVSGLNQTASIRADLGIPISRIGSDLYIPFFEYSTIFGYRYPYVLDLPVTFASTLGLDRVEVQPIDQTLLTRARFEGRLEKKFSSKVTGTYRLLRVERTTTQSFYPTMGTPTTESIGSTGPGLIVDLRDDIFNPHWGSFHALEIEFASPLLFSQADISFVMAMMRNSFYVPLGSNVQTALYVGLGVAQSLFDQPLARARLVNELSLGGQGSIRGITPRALTPDPNSKSMAFYNARAEITFKLIADFGLAVFFDTGQIFPDFQAVERSDGVGIGLRYKTPVGPVVIDFAQGLGKLGGQFKFYFTVGTF